MSKSVEFNGMKLKVGNDPRILFAAVQSSNIQALAYDVDSETVHAVFKTNVKKRYEYAGVPFKTFMKVMEADSLGSSFNSLIKSKYEATAFKNK